MPPRTTRPRRSPRFPPLRSPGPALEGLEVLHELPCELGVVLWQSLRDLALWAGATPGAVLFAPEAAGARTAELLRVAAGEDELLAPLAVFATVLSPATPPDVPRLVHACRRVAAWAQARGHLGAARTALLTAAAVAPNDAGVAAGVGRLWRMQGRYEDARAWFLHAAALARRTGAPRAHAEALAGLGVLHAQRGQYYRAARQHRRCLALARRHGLREMEGAAWHNLAVCAAEQGEHARAEVRAARALEAYPAGCDRLPRLAHDLALIWMLLGRFASALRVLPRLLDAFTAPADRLDVLGDLARAAGGAGDAAAFERAWSQAAPLLAGGRSEECAARVLVGLARGACGVRQWARAEWAAGRGAACARSRGEERHAAEAEALLQQVRLRTGPAPPGPGESCPGPLAERMCAALSAPIP